MNEKKTKGLPPLMSEDEIMVALTNLQYRAQAGEDIRWDKVGEVIAKAQWDICVRFYNG